jgi:ABC-2 type transport system permease protein
MQLVGIVLAAGAVVRERERGTLEQLLVTPVHPLGLMLGKLCPYLFFSLIEMTMALLLMRYGFSVPIRSSLVILYGSAVVYLCALLALGLLISTGAATQMEAQQSAQLVFLPSVFLSGYIFPFEGLPIALKAIGFLFPATHMINIMRGVVLREATVLDLVPSIAALIVLATVLVLVAARTVRKSSR